MQTKFYPVNLKERNHLGELLIDEKIIFFKKRDFKEIGCE
jgi:hypothetical protein